MITIITEFRYSGNETTLFKHDHGVHLHALLVRELRGLPGPKNVTGSSLPRHGDATIAIARCGLRADAAMVTALASRDSGDGGCRSGSAGEASAKQRAVHRDPRQTSHLDIYSDTVYVFILLIEQELRYVV